MNSKPKADTASSLLDGLVDDREIRNFNDDRLGHSLIVEQLSVLAATVETPANIALYGEWGSGKSGIANLLGQRLQDPEFVDANGKCRFATFDAFKYSESPMRRYFLTQVGDQVLTKKTDRDALRDNIYYSSTDNDLTIPKWSSLWKVFIAIIFLVVAVALVAFAATVPFVVFGDAVFWSTYLGFVSALLVPSALVAGFIAVAGKTFQVTRHRESPSSDEQFEEAFIDLVAKAKSKKYSRLVIFVDELDRCSPDQVVDTLDTIRTFLDAPDTVIIVAADQRALEEALTHKVRQATPSDIRNPYHSSGTAYLDKVFHYQVSLPPLQTHRVTQYVVDLLSDKGGVWSDLDTGLIASVLVPSHVNSPRRVKMLLNNFVLTYGALKKRCERNAISSGIVGREDEIAKLVCLQTEFPLFARDLAHAEYLPELVVMILESRSQEDVPEKPAYVSAQEWELAHKYVERTQQVDLMLVDSPSDQSDDSRPSTARTAQLHRYLMKTKHVPGPARDLVFHEGRGVVHGLPDGYARDLASAAIEGLYDEVRRVFVAWQDDGDSDSAEPVLTFLIQLVNDALPGIEGDNATTALLTSVAKAPHEDVDKVAVRAIQAVLAHLRKSDADLRRDDLPGALQLALRGKHGSSNKLAAQILEHPAALDDPALGMTILGEIERLPKGDSGQPVVDAVIAARIYDPESSAAAIRRLYAHPETLKWSLPTMNAAVSDGDGSEPEDAQVGIKAAIDAASADGQFEIAELLLHVPLNHSEEDEWALIASEYLSTRSTIEDGALITAILLAAASRSPDELVLWLSVVPDDHSPTVTDLDALRKAANELWAQRAELGTTYDAHDEDYLAAIRDVARLSPPNPDQELTELALGQTPAVQPQRALDVEAHWGWLRRFADEGMISTQDVADELAHRLVAALPASPVNGQISGLTKGWVPWILDHADEVAAQQIVEAIASTPSIPSPEREYMALNAASRRTDTTSPFGTSGIESQVEADPTGAKPLAAKWIEFFADDFNDVLASLTAYLDADDYEDPLREAVRVFAQRSALDARLSLLDAELALSDQRDPNLSYLSDLEVRDLGDAAVAASIKRTYSRIGTNQSIRERIFRVWNAVLPLDLSAQMLLIDHVLIPSLRRSKSTIELAKRYDAVWRDPESRRDELKGAFRKAAGGKDQDRALERLMHKNGVVIEQKRSFMPWSRAEEVEEASLR